MSKRKCLLCDNTVYPQNEVDVGVGTIISNEPAICEDCYHSKPEQVDKIFEEERKLMDEFDF